MRHHLLAALAFGLAACEQTPPGAISAAVGLKVGAGPHQGVIQESRGTRVEVVPMGDGTIRAYLFDDTSAPVKAQGEVKATITAPSYEPAEVVFAPAAEGAYYVGKLPGPAPKAPADMTLFFPQGVELEYRGVPLVAEAQIFAPGVSAGAVVVAPAPAAPAVAVVPADFVPPHKGTVSRVGDNLVEVVIAPKGDVQAYVYELDGAPVPIAEVEIPVIEIAYAGKPYKVKLAPAPGQVYLTGHIDAKVSIPAKAKVDVVVVEPVRIHGVVYTPDVVIFTPLVVYEPVVIVPVVAAPVVVVPAPAAIIEVRPPSISIGVGVSIGGKVKYSGKHKGKGHYKHSHKHSR
jgi:hypothetical protein